MKKMLLKRLIFLIVFIEIALGITYFFIMRDMPITETEITDSVDKEVIEEEPEQVSVKTVSLDETYDLNDLKITKYEETIENANFTRNYNSDYTSYTTSASNVNYSYFQIDGLSNESIEISINYALKKDLETAIDEILNNSEFESELNIESTICANFANVISIKYCLTYCTNDDGYESTYIGENFDLETGNRLKLNDIILNTANMRQILSEKLYDKVISATSNLELKSEWDLTYIIEDYNDVEETILEVVSNFKNEKDINFSFNEYQVSFLDFDCNILYNECLDYVIIYDKFSNDDIYDGKYSNYKDLLTLTKVDQYANYVVIEEADNYLIYASLDSEFDEDILSGEKSYVVEWFEEKVQEMKDLAESNQNTFYVFNYFCNAYYSSEWNSDYSELSYNYDFGDIYEYSYVIETTKSSYNNSLKPEIIEVLRDYPSEEMGDAYLYGGLFADYLINESFERTFVDYIYDLQANTIYNKDSANESEETYTIWDTVD